MKCHPQCTYLAGNVFSGSEATTWVRWEIMHAFRSQEFQDTVCQTLCTLVHADLSCRRKPCGHFWDKWYICFFCWFW